jgi:hypothetical protein
MTVTFTWMIYTTFAIMRLFFHKVCVIFNMLLPTLSKMLYISVLRSCHDLTAHHENFVSICSHLQSSIQLMYPLWSHAGGSQRVAEWGMGKSSPSHFWDCLMCAEAGVRPAIVVKEKDVFHVSVRTNCTDALSWFV